MFGFRVKPETDRLCNGQGHLIPSWERLEGARRPGQGLLPLGEAVAAVQGSPTEQSLCPLPRKPPPAQIYAPNRSTRFESGEIRFNSPST